MKHILNFIAGLFIGAGLILPGVSGGVLAIVLGVYEDIIYAISNIFKEPKKQMIFLIPLGLGLVISMIIFGNILEYLFTNYEFVTKYAFIGLILGSLPILFDKLIENGKVNFKPTPFLIALIIGLSLYLLDKYILLENNVSLNGDISSYFILFIGGLFYAMGKIVPGISSSFLLMILGIYEYVLGVIANPWDISLADFWNVVALGSGLLIGLVVLVKAVEKLLDKHFNTLYSSVIGFILGSIVIIYPGFKFAPEQIIAIILFIVMFAVSYAFSNYKKSHNN